MLIKKPDDIRSSEITPKVLYINRRQFIVRASALAAAAVGCGGPAGRLSSSEAFGAGAKLAFSKNAFSTDEKLTPYKDVTNYNNYYEFSTDKYAPAELAKGFKPLPWSVSIERFVKKFGKYDFDTIMKMAPLEERIYRMRCVEGWSMVIPWIGFPLNALIKHVEPTSQAKFIEFTSVYRPDEMPGQRRGVLEYPYVEGLRLDEALHPLTILAVGLYGEVLPSQNGAPLRLVVPWKYGFKGIKGIVKIRFVENQPTSSWTKAGPKEYGFYSNVNPQVDHPRWSQASERRLGEFFKRKTLMFNGYGDQVAQLYTGMDLRKNF